MKYKKLLNHLIFKSSSHQKNETDISKVGSICVNLLIIIYNISQNLIIIDDSHEAIGEKSLPSARDQMDGFVKVNCAIFYNKVFEETVIKILNF